MSKFWEFKNKENTDEIELRISGEIVSDDDAWIYEWLGISASSPNAFREELSGYKGKNIRVWIDSYGGDVFAGAGIYNALKEHDGKVTTVVDGKAMSAASVIAMAGEEIQMSPVGLMMIHNPMTFSYGEAKDMRHAADVLDEVKETIINAYQIKTSKSRNKISEMMDNETFMSARTAIKEGFADKILYTDTKEQPIENNFSFSHISIQNSMANSMSKFFEVAKQTSDSQTSALESQAVNNTKNEKDGEPPMYKTVDEIKAACPDLVKQIENAAREEGRKEERERIQAIEKISNTMDPDLVNKAKYVDPKDAKELAFEAAVANAAKGAQHLKDAYADNDASGVKNVTADPSATAGQASFKAKQEEAASEIAAAANRRRGM